MAAGQNSGHLKIFQLKEETRPLFPLQVDDISAELEYKNGTRRTGILFRLFLPFTIGQVYDFR